MQKMLTGTNYQGKLLAVKSNTDLANLLEISLSTLIYYAFKVIKDSQYSTFQIPKKNGEMRTITAPKTKIKIIQQKLNFLLQHSYLTHTSAFGFLKGKSIADNAKKHIRKDYLLKMDIKDFFDEINFGRVRGMFMAYPFNYQNSLATTLANLCCYKDKLPQGAPTSPMIANLVCWRLDKDLSRLARRYGCSYSRYADDIVLSSHNPIPSNLAFKEGGLVFLGETILDLFSEHGFQINADKTTLKDKKHRQLVTGLVVNNGINIKREYIRNLRRMLHIWEKYGLNSLQIDPFYTYLSPYKPDKQNLYRISGKLAFLKNIRTHRGDIELYIKFKKWFDYLVMRDNLEVLKLTTSYQSRGYSLEKLFHDIFKVNNIEVYESFRRNQGTEQIDGAIVLNSGEHILIECKWTSDTNEINSEIAKFRTRIRDSGSTTLGIFISMAGWNSKTISSLKMGSDKNVMLLGLQDLETILNNRLLNINDYMRKMVKQLKVDTEPYYSAVSYLTDHPIS